MKLLILTQKIDKDDQVLGFFHGWVSALASRYEQITVICLQKGVHALPPNVKVFSLGKEAGPSRLKYLFNFFRYIIQLRKNYDAVFIHMNQEYVLLGSFIWGILGKRIFLWRNHPEGNMFTSLAVLLCDKTFCTSKFSYLSRFKKNELMPVGIDETLFRNKSEPRVKDVLFLGRMSPIKRPDLLLEALGKLKESGRKFSAGLYGDPLPKDQIYYEELQKKALQLRIQDLISFSGGIPNVKTPEIYNIYRIFVNLTPSGSYDKTIFEAALCGALPLSSNMNLKGEIDPRLLFEENSAEDLSKKLLVLLSLPENETLALQEFLRNYVTAEHSLKALIQKLSSSLQSSEGRRPFLGTILKYIISGGTAAFVDLLFLYLFTSVFHVWYLISAVLAFLVAFGVSFFLQKFWAFQDVSTTKLHAQMALYFFITSLNLGVNTLLMYLFVNSVHIPYLFAQIIASGLIAFMSFFLYQKFVFKKRTL